MPESHTDVQDLPEGYRITELGPLPETWRVVRLGEVVVKTELIDPRKMPKKRFKYIDVSSINNERLRILAVKEVQGEDAPSRARKAVRSGDVIFATVRPYLKRVAIVPHELDGQVCSTAFCVLRAGSRIISQYLFYAVIHETFVEMVSERQRGSSYPAVTDKDVLQTPIPLPPLPEQRAIAHVLRTVQEAKEATERVIAALRDLKRSLMHHLFTYGPVPVDTADQVALQDTPIGPIPAHWRVVRLGEVTHKPQYGYTASATQEPVGPKFLRITDIQNERVHWPSVPFCVIPDDLLDKYRLQEGDILFARIGATTGKTYLVTKASHAIFASYLIRVRAHSNQLLPGYLYFFTHTSQYWQQINAAKGGRLKQGINIPILTSLRIPLPPLDEQREIAGILQTVDRKIEAEEARKAALEGLFKSLLYHLMTAKVRLPREFIERFEGNKEVLE